MASAARITRYTPEQYLAMERKAEFKSEYDDGFITAMSGASRPHNLISANFSRQLGNQLEQRSCETYQSDMRVLVSRTGLYTYPDVVVVCGQAQFDDREVDTLLNPTVIVEVLSPSTGIPTTEARSSPITAGSESLKEYVLVAQDEVRIEQHHLRPGDTWQLSDLTDIDDTLSLESIDCKILREIYARVEFPSSPSPAEVKA